MTQTLKLTSGAKSALAFAAPAVATLDVRHYLTGALLTSHKGHLAAVGTDGFFIAVACTSIDMPTAWADVILPPAALKAATHKTAAVLEVDGLKVTVIAADGTRQEFQAVEGKYPDWYRLLQSQNVDNVTTEPMGLNLEFLSRLGKGLKAALKLAGKKGAKAVPFMRFHMLAFGGQPDSALLRYETVADDAAAVEFHAVVMRARV